MRYQLHHYFQETPEARQARQAERDGNLERVLAYCYVPGCGAPYETYQGVRTIPQEPYLVHDVKEIEPCDTCRSDYCKAYECERQDRLYALLLAPLLEKLKQSNAAELAKAKRENK